MLHHFADAIRAADAKPRQQAQLYNEMLRVIALDQLPIRPYRSEPRGKKRRPKPNLEKRWKLPNTAVITKLP
jgi:hypothetical protein